MSWSRRRLLGAAGMLAGASAAGVLKSVAAEHTGHPRRIRLENRHTLESLDLVYRDGGDYLPGAMLEIQRLLRDHRTGMEHPIDPALMDYLCDAARLMGVDPAFTVISGYRSPRTNDMLPERSSALASRSLHVQGRAMDVQLAGVDCADLAEHALSLRRGGLGYYKTSDFVHLDTGRFRTWRG
jgi:uncharacterized protein YcbK (DUF882 family)